MSEALRPRVLILVKGLGLGGVERLLSESIPYLDRDRFEYEVCFFTPWKDDVVPEFEQAGIPVSCLDLTSDRDPASFTRLRKHLRKGSYDIIHTHSPFPSVVARVVAPRKRLSGFVHTEHSLPESRNPLTRVANRLTYPTCDIVVPVSRAVEHSVKAARLLKPKATQLVYGGIDDASLAAVGDDAIATARQSLQIASDHRIVGNVAHLREQKGLEVWLDAAKEVVEALPTTTFVLVGREKEPGYRAHLEAHAGRIGIAEHVRFAGFQRDPYPYMGAFDVFLMSSEYEGFPIALVEAMAMGVAVVSTDVGGVREALGPERTGLLADPGDSSGLARQVLALLQNDEMRADLARSAQERARTEFTVRHMVEQVESLYEGLLSSKSATPP